jgi:hypothetical protein
MPSGFNCLSPNVLFLLALHLQQVHGGLVKLDEHRTQVERNTAEGAWGHSGDRKPAVPLDDLMNLGAVLGSTEKRHKELLQAFLKGLPDAANEVSF